MLTVSREFADRITGAFGSDGEHWLAVLPTTLQELSLKWSLMLDTPFEDMAYNYVTPATRSDGSRAVLKVGVPNPELYFEISALRAFGGRGTVHLLDADSDLGALLLERLDPGQPILDLGDDDHATSAACDVMLELQKVSIDNGSFPTVADWGKGLDRLRFEFGGGTGPFPASIVERAESDLRELSNSMGEPRLLHADLHHWNVLSARRSPWLAIDPKGLIGELEYETGAWIRNPIPALLDWTDARMILRRRIDRIAERLEFDPERILAWGIYQAVLAGWWSYEDGQPNWEKWAAIAELIAGSEK